MARIARVAVPGIPHHVIQRGNRRQQTFWTDSDYQYYLLLMKESCQQNEVSIWAYCLMPNHVHLVMVPETEEGLTKAIGQVHHRYTRMINFRQKWKGHLWQGRYSSYPMDENYLIACVRYIEMNPVRAGLVEQPEEWQWSSAGYHLGERKDEFIADSPLSSIIDNWREFLKEDPVEGEIFQKHEHTGRPLGTREFIESCGTLLNRDLTKQKTGPKGPRKKRRNKRKIK